MGTNAANVSMADAQLLIPNNKYSGTTASDTTTSPAKASGASALHGGGGHTGGIGGHTGGIGGCCGGIGGCCGVVVGAAQIINPALFAVPSLYQVISSPAAMSTPLGPLVPQYRMPPMVMRSKLQLRCDSTSKPALAVTVIALSARTVHASSLPYQPAPSVTHSPSLPVSSQ